jgi:hypothetical protein
MRERWLFTSALGRLLLVLGCGFAGGCFPSGVVWLPDSSGIVYSDKTGSRLVRYDLETKARKVIVADTKTRTHWPAISKDGKKVAVADCSQHYEKDSTKVQYKLCIITYALTGEELARSKTFEFTEALAKPAAQTKDVKVESALNWSGPQDKLLVYSGVTGIYDLEKGTFARLEPTPFPYYNRPVRPDGKQFLAIGKGDKLVSCDWQGRQTDLGVLPPHDVLNPVHFAWTKGVYRMHGRSRIFEADTSSNKVGEIAEKVPVVAAEGDLQLSFPFAASQSRLCIFAREDEKKNSKRRLEIQRPALGQRKVILAEGDYNLDPMQVFPSPDDKLVALRCLDGQKKVEHILVVNASGEIIARITPEK